MIYKSIYKHIHNKYKLLIFIIIKISYLIKKYKKEYILYYIKLSYELTMNFFFLEKKLTMNLILLKKKKIMNLTHLTIEYKFMRKHAYHINYEKL